MPIQTSDELKIFIAKLASTDWSMLHPSASEAVEKLKGDIQSMDASLIDIQDDEGTTLLMAAAATGSLNIVNAVLDKNPDLTLTDEDQWSALDYAITSLENHNPGIKAAMIDCDPSPSDPRISYNEVIVALLKHGLSVNDDEHLTFLKNEYLNHNFSEDATPHMALHTSQCQLLDHLSAKYPERFKSGEETFPPKPASSQSSQQLIEKLRGGGAAAEPAPEDVELLMAAPPPLDKTDREEDSDGPGGRSPSPPG